MTERTCTKCGETKPLGTEHFYRQGKGRAGFNAQCKDCNARYTREYRARSPEAIQANRDSVKRWLAKPGNVEKARARSAEWYANGGREWARDYLRQKTYGITPADYKRLLLIQGGVCAICRQDETRTIKTGERRPLTVDHDHETGSVRGLLCSLCNTALGSFRDDAEILAAAIDYLAQAAAKERIG